MRVLFHDHSREGDRSWCQRETLLHRDTELKSTEESSDKKQTHMLSDGNIITVGAERFRSARVFFSASLIGIKASGAHDTSFHYIMKCHVATRKELYNTVVLSVSMTCSKELRSAG